MLDDLSNDGLDLLERAVFQHALDDSAPERVLRKHRSVAIKGVDDELDVLPIHSSPIERARSVTNSLARSNLDALLHDVVAVGVQHAMHHMALQLLHQRQLFIHASDFKRFLDHTTAVDLKGQRHQVGLDQVDETPLLVDRAVIQQFLDDVVPEHIDHQLQSIGQNLLEHYFLRLVISNLDLVLDEPRAILIPGEHREMTLESRELPPLELRVGTELLQEGMGRVRMGSRMKCHFSTTCVPLLGATSISRDRVVLARHKPIVARNARRGESTRARVLGHLDGIVPRARFAETWRASESTRL